jgi:hypothetical protein
MNPVTSVGLGFADPLAGFHHLSRKLALLRNGFTCVRWL